MIRIVKVSEAKLRLVASKEILVNVASHLEFYAVNYQHMSKYKSGAWDGKIRLLNSYNGLAPAGLAFHITELLDEMGHEYELDDGFSPDSSITEDIAVEIAKECGTSFEPREYQIDAVYEALHHRRRLILSPTASGKSFTLFLINKYLEMQDKKTLIIVPRIALAKQLSTDYIDYQGHNKGLHTITGGVKKDSNELTICSTWQSVINQPEEWFHQFDAIIVDEAHEAKAKSITTIMESAINAEYRIGLTGTTDDELPNELTLQGHFGGKVVVAETWQLIENGNLADLLIKLVNISYDEDTRRYSKKLRNFNDEKTFLKLHKGRNELISGLAASQKGNVLVLVEQRDQLEELIKLTKAKTNREIFVIHGDVPVTKREQIRVNIESKDDVILFATYGSFSVGSNIKKLDKCILATSFKSKIRVLQSIGRTLRVGNGSTSAVVYDIADDMTYEGVPNHTYRHARARVEHYIKGKLKWKQIDVSLTT